MKKLITILLCLTATFSFAQVETMYRTATIATLKTYAGTATRLIVTATNDEYEKCSSCTTDEVTIYAGASGRKWQLISSTSRIGYVSTSKYSTDSTANKSAVNGKQATLISGTNIKTINSTSLLGSGDIVISGSGGSADTSSVVSSASYTIEKVGSTYYARPGYKSPLPLISNSDAYTVIQGAINNLTPAGSAGTGGGRIFIRKGTYSLSDELVITGWESGGQPYSQLTIEGEGVATFISQNTSGKNGLVIKNAASVALRNFSIAVGSSAKSCILADNNGATYETSLYKSSIDNVYCYGGNATYPGMYLKNFFLLNVGYLSVENTFGNALVLENASSSVLYGNSNFTYLHTQAANSGGYAGLKIVSSNSSKQLNLMTFGNYECTHGTYGIYTDYANSCTFNMVDIEGIANPIYLGAGINSLNKTYGFSFLSGYLLPTAGSTAVTCGGITSANNFRNIFIEAAGSSTVKPIVDSSNFARPNSFDVTLSTAATAANIYIANTKNTPLTYKTSSGTVTTVPNGALLSAGTATAGTAPLKFTSGALLTTPEAGATEFDGSHFYGTVGSTRYQLDQQSGGSGSVTSIATGNGLTGGTITTTGTLKADTSILSTKLWRQKGIDSIVALLADTAVLDLSTYAPLASPTFTGTVTMPTPFTLGATSVTTTGTKLNYLTSATGTTGTTSTNLVFSTSPTLVTPTLGTPTSVTLTNATGLPISTGISGLATGVATFLGTSTSANLAAALTNETGSGVAVFGTSPDFTTGATIGAVAIPTISSTNTLTNKRWTARVGSTTSSTTPTINTDNTDIYKLTAQTAAITSFTTNLTGTPADGDMLEIQVTGTAARAITWGSSFVSSATSLPTTTVTTATLTVVFQYFTTSSYGNNKWVCASSF